MPVTNSLFNLSSKVAVVSGAASGMGRAAISMTTSTAVIINIKRGARKGDDNDDDDDHDNDDDCRMAAHSFANRSPDAVAATVGAA